ncbi:MAG: phosphoribosylaminoimidazolesuccinocarboxamide synthase [Campylobacterales bacterium]
MKKGEFFYEGKAKKLYLTEDRCKVIMEFKDDLTAFNAQKKSNEEGKGSLNCMIATKIFELLEDSGITTHYINQIDSTHMLTKKCDIIPIEVITRNIATGSLTKRLGIENGASLPFALVEFCYKNDSLNDPIINDEHALIMKLVNNQDELELLKKTSRTINTILKEYFDKKGLILVDFKLEYGRDCDGNIILADEITPDSCRFWDKQTKEKLDKDLFREGSAPVKAAYEEILRRIMEK